jgi:hypothetical protein
MSADLLREAAKVLRGRAEAAKPGPWSAADEHGLMPDAWPAWCVSQMRPGYESMSPEDGYVTDVADVHGDDKTACPDADYIATMHPGVGLALADWLDDIAAGWMWDDDGAACDWDGMPLKLDEAVDSHAVKVARLILGRAS